jgi:hypothetical protein
MRQAILSSVARNDIKRCYFFLMLFLEEERDEELRLEDRLTLEEELFELREEDIFEEELELLLDDTDLEGEREETEELLEELRLTADLGAGDLDFLALVELILVLPPLWREERDGEELEILFLAEGVSDLDLEDFLKEEEDDG